MQLCTFSIGLFDPCGSTLLTINGTPSEFIAYFTNIRQRTARLVPLIPAGRIEWRLAPRTFSFGDILRHLAGTERWIWVENVAGRPSRYPGHEETLAPGYDATCPYFETLHQDALEIFAGMSDDAFTGRMQTPAGVSMPAHKWLRAMVEHEAHHRGQLYLMLRAVGVATPPLFGLTSEEVRARGEGHGTRAL